MKQPLFHVSEFLMFLLFREIYDGSYDSDREGCIQDIGTL